MKAAGSPAAQLSRGQQEIVALERACGCPPGVIAANHGLDEAAVRAFLGSEDGRKQIAEQQEREHRRRMRRWLP